MMYVLLSVLSEANKPNDRCTAARAVIRLDDGPVTGAYEAVVMACVTDTNEITMTANPGRWVVPGRGRMLDLDGPLV